MSFRNSHLALAVKVAICYVRAIVAPMNAKLGALKERHNQIRRMNYERKESTASQFHQSENG